MFLANTEKCLVIKNLSLKKKLFAKKKEHLVIKKKIFGSNETNQIITKEKLTKIGDSRK